MSSDFGRFLAGRSLPPAGRPPRERPPAPPGEACPLPPEGRLMEGKGHSTGAAWTSGGRARGARRRGQRSGDNSRPRPRDGAVRCTHRSHHDPSRAVIPTSQYGRPTRQPTASRPTTKQKANTQTNVNNRYRSLAMINYTDDC